MTEGTENTGASAPVHAFVMPWSRDLESLDRFCEKASLPYQFYSGTDTAAVLQQALRWIQYLRRFCTAVEHVHRVVANLSTDEQDVIVSACRATPGICFCGGHGSLKSGVDFGDSGEPRASA